MYCSRPSAALLLALENATTLAELSAWAGEIRGQLRSTARWHYVNIPLHPLAGNHWRVGSATIWATESNDIARRLIYGEWPHGPDALRASYEDLALPVVRVQLEKAAVRLAAVVPTGNYVRQY